MVISFQGDSGSITNDELLLLQNTIRDTYNGLTIAGDNKCDDLFRSIDQVILEHTDQRRRQLDSHYYDHHRGNGRGRASHQHGADREKNNPHQEQQGRRSLRQSQDPTFAAKGKVYGGCKGCRQGTPSAIQAPTRTKNEDDNK